MLSIERVIARAVGYAQGWITYTSPEPELIINPPVYELETYLQRAKVLVVDTEFDPNKRTTHIIGLTTDHLGTEKRVISLTKEGLSIGHLDTLRKHFMRRDLMKVAHYHQADVEALSWLGIDTCVPWHCTLAASSTLYPDLPCGLSHVARFYLDNVDDWKAEKDFTSLVYNGKDVLFTWGVYLNQRVELAEAGMYELFETEVMLTLPRLWAMQTQGLKTCKDSIKEVLKAGTKELNELQGKICNQVDAVFTKRKEPLEKIIHNSTEEIKNIESSWQGEIDTNPTLGCCLEHKKYNGMRAKKFNNKTEKCTCKKLNNEFLTRGLRDKITSLRKEITNSKNKIKRWEKGFDPNNNDHLRWLLYDKAGLGLPPQKDRETKRATANATAIAKLISLKGTQKKVGVVELLQDIKRYQRVGHMMSTFYDPPTDKNGVVHPPYRMHGTGTGRPAGGDDEQLHDKGSGGLKFNVLNIPDEARGIYVPFSEG
jgi:DNA polymerase I-like protein with 3'-5' exonuclease and polymerase domains